VGASGWERVKTAPAVDSIGLSKTKSREPKRNTVMGTDYAWEWAIRTLMVS
jgi:hypothetical protein